jgi:Fe-S-cluster containining protein
MSEISDGRIYTSNDCVRADTFGCEQCSFCCENMCDTIFLDPFDLYCLETCLHTAFKNLLADKLTLSVADGIALPHIMPVNGGACPFLDKNRRCAIHDYRPGFCRLFPLGRIYNNENGFNYYIQVNECKCKHRGKIKISKWLGIKDLKTYEKYISDWHGLLENIIRKSARGKNTDIARTLDTKLLQVFFMEPYDLSLDFYKQFYDRLQFFRQTLNKGDTL